MSLQAKSGKSYHFHHAISKAISSLEAHHGPINSPDVCIVCCVCVSVILFNVLFTSGPDRYSRIRTGCALCRHHMLDAVQSAAYASVPIDIAEARTRIRANAARCCFCCQGVYEVILMHLFVVHLFVQTLQSANDWPVRVTG